MLKHRQLTQERIAKFVSAFEKLFWKEKLPLEALASPRTSRISHDEAMRLKYRPVKKGALFGPRFATYWFKLRGEIPTAWRKSPVDVIFNTGAESTIWLNGNRFKASIWPTVSVYTKIGLISVFPPRFCAPARLISRSKWPAMSSSVTTAPESLNLKRLPWHCSTRKHGIYSMTSSCPSS